MSSYTAFARYYDSLTLNVNYPERAKYLCNLFSRYSHHTGITLDLACGTGSLTVELAKRGLDIYGIDGSMSMLSVAQQKTADNDLNILFLCQQMQYIDLYGTVDTVVCALDSINHLTSEKDVQSAFQRVSLFLNEDGFFVFDVIPSISINIFLRIIRLFMTPMTYSAYGRTIMNQKITG